MLASPSVVPFTGAPPPPPLHLVWPEGGLPPARLGCLRAHLPRCTLLVPWAVFSGSRVPAPSCVFPLPGQDWACVRCLGPHSARLRPLA